MDITPPGVGLLVGSGKWLVGLGLGRWGREVLTLWWIVS
jgi:hypothetical protein